MVVGVGVVLAGCFQRGIGGDVEEKVVEWRVASSVQLSLEKFVVVDEFPAELPVEGACRSVLVVVQYASTFPAHLCYFVLWRFGCLYVVVCAAGGKGAWEGRETFHAHCLVLCTGIGVEEAG